MRVDSIFIQDNVPIGDEALAPELALVAASGDFASSVDKSLENTPESLSDCVLFP
jgi:hypothetical protein